MSAGGGEGGGGGEGFRHGTKPDIYWCIEELFHGFYEDIYFTFDQKQLEQTM